MNQKSPKGFESPSLSTPKGGGALRGSAGSFQGGGFAGGASYSIPFNINTARDMEPQISISYHSGSGNGICGMGMSLGESVITRKTSLGTPHYNDQDIYILDGEELTPKLNYDSQANVWNRAYRTEQSYIIYTYLPRIESSFDIIELWIDKTTDISFWKIKDSANTISIYGKDASARSANPGNNAKVFSWYLQEHADDKGNKLVYEYEIDHDNFPYLKYIHYGNYIIDEVSYYAYTVAIDYGTFNSEQPDIIPTSFVERPDVFSNYIAGFEIRCSRLVHHLLLYHQFSGLFNGAAFLTQCLKLSYGNTDNASTCTEILSGISFLHSVEHVGYRKEESGKYILKTLPPLELSYNSFKPENQQYQIIKTAEGSTIQGYLSLASSFQLFDLNGEGLPGFLYSNEHSTMYYAPLGEGLYSAPQQLTNFPSELDLSKYHHSLISLNANGETDLVIESPHRSGYYKKTGNNNWDGFQSFNEAATELYESSIQWVDLTGNGLPDMVVFEPDYLKFYPALGQEGYGAALQIPYTPDFPSNINDSEEELFTFADIVGDGMMHYVKVTNGNVTYWPSKGYGHFETCRTMQKAPHFGESLDAKRLHLVDIDGTGTSDFVYIEHDYIKVWFNQCGTKFSEPILIKLPVSFDQIKEINFGDIHGTGTTCIIVSIVNPEVQHFYYDFAGDVKPYLLKSSKNNVGAKEIYTYSTSVKQYLEDKRNGRLWPTHLFFPVHVLASMEVIDETSGAYHVERYKYHDGYYDSVERTFRGFGFVESWDTDLFQPYQAASTTAGFPVHTVNEELHTAPTYTKTWYHTGAYIEAEKTAAFYQKEYYSGDVKFYSVQGQQLGPSIYQEDAETYRQAFAAMDGQKLRQELYGLDHSALAHIPYSVSETEIYIRLLQPKNHERYAVFHVSERQTIDYYYDRNQDDPRVSHEFNLAEDLYGNELLACFIVYPRREQSKQYVFEEQLQLVITAQQNFVTNLNGKISDDTHLIGVPIEEKSFEFSGIPAPKGSCYTFKEIEQFILQGITHAIPYQQAFDTDKLEARLYEWSQSYFWNADQSAVLPLGEICEPLLLHHQETALYPIAELNNVYINYLTQEELIYDAGYISHDDYYWNAGLTSYYFDAAAYYLDKCTKNDYAPANNLALQPLNSITYDIYYLFPISSSQYTSETTLMVTADIDYQACSISRITDCNGNCKEVLFDPLGYVIAQTEYGSILNKPFGDAPMSEFQIKLGTIEQILTQPELYLQNASVFYHYDFFAWMHYNQPVCSLTLSGQYYQSQLYGQANKIQQSINFTDGLGRTLAIKTLTEPGSLATQDREGNIVYASVSRDENYSDNRWICSGQTVYNNKGNPVQQFKNYYSNGWQYENVNDLISAEQLIAPTIIHYDALSRTIKINSPKGYFSQVEIGSWQTKHYDANDTLLDSDYYIQNTENASLTIEELKVLNQAALCYNSPSISITDSLGRTFRSVVDNLGALTTEKLVAEGFSQTNADQIITNLLSANWIEVDQQHPTIYWFTDLFQPFTNGFPQQFNIGGVQSAQLLNYLKKARLTTNTTFDISGNELQTVDPRLFWTNLNEGTAYQNFEHIYLMTDDAIYTKSADGGNSLVVDDILDNSIHHWDARNFHIQNFYDQLQRQIYITVDGGDGVDIARRVVNYTIYGDILESASERNMVGKAFQAFDGAGATEALCYDIAGNVLEANRYFSDDYISQANWTPDARASVLTQKAYRSACEHDAIGGLIKNVSPDGSVNIPIYNIAGQLSSLTVTPHDKNKQTQTILTAATYDPDGKALQIIYGNGIINNQVYEATTGLLLSQICYAKRGLKAQTPIASIHYIYDPVGNVAAKRNETFNTVFSSNQQVDPINEYSYNLIYELIQANGRQIKYQGTAPSKESKSFSMQQGITTPFANPNDQNALENYQQNYSYDDGGNLTQLKHVATKSYTQNYTIAAQSNRLTQANKPLQYDEGGNMKALDHLSVIVWNYANQLTQATVIEREETMSDAEYYQYDGSGNRVRKVTERMINGGQSMEVTEKLYIGSYEYKTVSQVSLTTNNKIIYIEKHSLKMNGIDGLLCMVHYWDTDLNHRETSNGGTIYRYQHSDIIGSVALETNEEGATISYEEYYPYGETSYMVHANHLSISLKEYRYSGQEKDNTTGLYYYGMRYYPAWLCRWINPDPAGTIDGLNLYAFVSGNPVTHKDIGGMGISLDKRHSSVASKKAGKKGAKKYFLTKGISRFTNSGKYKYYYKGRIVQKEFKKRNFGYKITNLDRPSGWPKYVTKELAKKFPGAINKKFKVKSGDVVCHHKQWMVIKKGFQTNFRGKTLDDINAELINSTGVTFNYPKLKKSFLAAIENGKPASRAKKSNPAKKTKRLPKASMVEAIGIMIRDEYYDPNNLFMESYAPATGPNNSSLGATAGNYIISLQNDYKGLSKKPLTTTDRKTRYNEILKASFDFPKNFVDPSTGTSMPAPSMTTNAKKQFLKEAYKLWD